VISLLRLLALTRTGAKATISGENVIVMKYETFKPSVLEVKMGSKVIWLNQDPEPHLVVSDPAENAQEGELFTSEKLLEGWSFSFVFTEAGTYGYHCLFHPEARGKVIVEGDS